MAKKEVTKPIWQSKSIWAAVVILAVTIASAAGIDLPLETIYGIAGAFGLYGLRTAQTAITVKK